MSRGRLRVLLGAAPGVGKTYTMLEEGKRLVLEGHDVVVAIVETHGRVATTAMTEGLEILPRRQIEYRGTVLNDMDLDAVLTRKPDYALVDELAHSNAPGLKHAKRWEDIEDLLDAGINVISTVNIQHIESLNDVVEEITNVPQRETVPDRFLRTADTIEVVDLAPQALRDRLSAGNVYPAERIDAALSNYFRLGNLTALRELALLWLADEVDSALKNYREEHGIANPWEARERIVVALTGGPEGETLLRRGARIASRTAGGELIAVHVVSPDGLRSGTGSELLKQRALVEQLGGSYHQVVGEDIPRALVKFAQSVNASQLVIGASRRSSLSQVLTGPSFASVIAREVGKIDVHLVNHAEAAKRRRLPRIRGGALTRARKITGLLVALLGVPLLTLLLTSVSGQDTNVLNVLVFQTFIVVVALIGGLIPALVTAIFSSLILNFFFIDPLYTITINEPRNTLALVIFVIVAILVSVVVDRAARQTRAAERAAAESELLATVAGSVLRGKDAVQAILDRILEAFPVNAVNLIGEDGNVIGSGHSSPVLLDSAVAEPTRKHSLARKAHEDASVSHKTFTGTIKPAQTDADVSLVSPPNKLSTNPVHSTHSTSRDGNTNTTEKTSAAESTSTFFPIGSRAQLELLGSDLDVSEQRLLLVLAAQLDAALEHNDLTQTAMEIEPLAASERVRSALLAALSHDLRRPLASATAAVSALKWEDGVLTPEDTHELIMTADESLAALSALIGDLLDVSKLEAGVLRIKTFPVDAADVIAPALDELGAGPDRIELDLGIKVPRLLADPALLQRAIANLLLNAMRYSPANKPVTISTSAFSDRVEIRVIDHGPGVPSERFEDIFIPFQRQDDTDNSVGLGLGLALSRGFIDGMGGSLNPEHTPGGGLTMVVSLPTEDSFVEPIASDNYSEATEGK